MASSVEIASSFVEGAPPGEVRTIIPLLSFLRNVLMTMQLGDVVAGMASQLEETLPFLPVQTPPTTTFRPVSLIVCS